MDWPKAKRILIIGFLVLDLYLAWMLFFSSKVNVVSKLLPADVLTLGSLCQHYGVELAADPIPLEVPLAGNVALSESADQATLADWLASTWLAPGYTVTQPAAGSFHYQSDGWSLKITPSRFHLEFSLETSSREPSGAPGESAKGIQPAQAFLAAHLGQKVALSYQVGLVTKDQAGLVTEIEFNRSEQGLPSFMDYYRLRLQGGQVVGFHASQSYGSEAGGKKQQLVTADRPLTRYLAQVGQQAEQLTIMDLRLGLGLLPGDEQTLQPVWRLTTTASAQGQVEVFFPAGMHYWGDGNR